MSEIATVGLDLAKNVFQVHGADAKGGVVFRKKLRRSVDLSRFRGAPNSHLRGLSLEGQGAFPAQG